MKKDMAFAALVVAGLVSAPAFAADGSGFLRVEGGRSDLDISVDDVGSAGDKDTTWGVRGGYWCNANFAVEGFYDQLYSTSFSDGFDTYNLKLHAVGIGLAAKKNFGTEPHKGFFVGGRVGVARGVATVEIDGSVDDAEASSAKPYFGVGAGYDFNENFGLSVNYDRLKGGGDGFDVTAKTLTLGLEARF